MPKKQFNTMSQIPLKHLSDSVRCHISAKKKKCHISANKITTLVILIKKIYIIFLNKK